MGLLSIFNRKSASGPGASEPGGTSAANGAPRRRQARAAAAATTYNAPPDAAEAVREARARARRRLMGATVLLLAGIIGFPLLFETQPRPIPVDLPIDIPPRNAVAGNDALVQNGAQAGHAGGATSSSVQPIGPAPVHVASGQSESVTYDTRSSVATASPALALAPAPRATGEATRAASSESARTATPDANRAATTSAPHDATHTGATTSPQSAPPTQPIQSAQATQSTAAASRAYAMLNPSASPAAATAAVAGGDAASDANRFVVQIGAFADDAKVHDARAKVEKLGLKTYTQSVDTPAGKRVRVRVGPYATHADADKAAGRIKADGLPAVVLVL